MAPTSSLSSYILSFLVFFPLGATLIISLIPQTRNRVIHFSGILATLVSATVTFYAISASNLAAPDLQLAEKYHWIPSIGAQFSLGLDGLGCIFLIISNLIGFLAIAFLPRDHNRKKEIILSVLVLMFSMHGVFLASDLLLFALFFCFCPVPGMFLILATTRSRRLNQTLQFFVYNLIGSLFIVIGVLAIHVAISKSIAMYTFDISKILLSGIPLGSQFWIFWVILIGMAIRIGLFPFHGWLVDVSEDTSFPGSMFLMAGFTKIGVFGMLRILLPLFPDALIRHTPILIYFALVSVVFAALAAIVQENYNKLLAYSTVHQMGLIALGMFLANKLGLFGAVTLALTHTLILAVLMILLDYLHSRIPSVLFLEYGGLIRSIPIFSAGFLLIALAYAGLPGLCSFPGVFQICLGSVAVNPVWASFILTGLFLGAIYSVQLFLRIFTGPESSLVKKAEFSGSRYVWLGLAPFILLILFLGITPETVIKPIQAPVLKIESVFQSRRMLLRTGQPTGVQPMTPGAFRMKPKEMDAK